ncbi:hypothetical protein F5878DRAFT_685486, partial [Lentinula raphanica]
MTFAELTSRIAGLEDTFNHTHVLLATSFLCSQNLHWFSLLGSPPFVIPATRWPRLTYSVRVVPDLVRATRHSCGIIKSDLSELFVVSLRDFNKPRVIINTLPKALIRLDPKQLLRRTLDIQVKNTINETVRCAFPKICEPITTFRGLVKDLRESIVAHKVPVYIPPILSDSSIVVAKLRDLLSSDVFRGISYSIGGNGEYLGGYASDMDVIGDFGRSFSIRGGYFEGRRIFDGVGH